MVEVVRTDGTLGGEPRIDGTRIGVLDVYELVVGGRHEPADAADQLGLSLAAVYAALSYYYEHADEMRTLRDDREAAETELSDTALSPPEHAVE